MPRFFIAFALLLLIAILVQSGILIGDVATTPALSASWLILKYASIALVFLAVMFFALRNARKPAVSKIIVPSLPQTPMFNETLLTTMFHTARLTGDISQTTLQNLLRSYKHLTGQTVSQGMISAKYAQRTETADLLSIMAPFSRIERDTMMKGCIDVAMADDEISTAENDFLMDLNNALGLDGDLFRNQVRADLRPDQPAGLRTAAILA